jgi:hypothetical protein
MHATHCLIGTLLCVDLNCGCVRCKPQNAVEFAVVDTSKIIYIGLRNLIETESNVFVCVDYNTSFWGVA